jgi:hypothetical protein
MTDLTAEEVADLLELAPHPEGGFFRETYRSGEVLDAGDLPPRYDSERAVATAIYFLITRESFSAFHRLRSDELFHWHAGGPTRLLRLWPGGELDEVVLGPDLRSGQVPQAAVPAGTWQALHVEAGDWSLLGTTVAPGFDFADFEIADRAVLADAYPDHERAIEALTR